MSATTPAAVRPQLQPGDRVNYVMPKPSRNAGEVRGAVVVRNFGDGLVTDGPLLNLQVFTDGTNDRAEDERGNPLSSCPYSGGMAWVTSVHHDPEGEVQGTWHYYSPTWSAPVHKAPVHSDPDPADRGEGG
jgi:hypothetical protein